MRIAALACLAATLLFAGSMAADAATQKPKSTSSASCNRQACTETCIKRGGRSQYCGGWCDRQIAASAKCK